VVSTFVATPLGERLGCGAWGDKILEILPHLQRL
jgi:hypothetical protein